MQLSKTSAFLTIVFATIACTDAEKKNSADSVNAIDTLKPLGTRPVIDSSSIDSTRTNTTTDSSAEQRGVLPPRGGETYRRGSTVSPRDQQRNQDPPPNVIGETRKPGGVMGSSPLPTAGRDSAYGPKLTIDEKGNVVPIKR